MKILGRENKKEKPEDGAQEGQDEEELLEPEKRNRLAGDALRDIDKIEGGSRYAYYHKDENGKATKYGTVEIICANSSKGYIVGYQIGSRGLYPVLLKAEDFGISSKFRRNAKETNNWLVRIRSISENFAGRKHKKAEKQ